MDKHSKYIIEQMFSGQKKESKKKKDIYDMFIKKITKPLNVYVIVCRSFSNRPKDQESHILNPNWHRKPFL